MRRSHIFLHRALLSGPWRAFLIVQFFSSSSQLQCIRTFLDIASLLPLAPKNRIIKPMILYLLSSALIKKRPLFSILIAIRFLNGVSLALHFVLRWNQELSKCEEDGFWNQWPEFYELLATVHRFLARPILFAVIIFKFLSSFSAIRILQLLQPRFCPWSHIFKYACVLQTNDSC